MHSPAFTSTVNRPNKTLLMKAGTRSIASIGKRESLYQCNILIIKNYIQFNHDFKCSKRLHLMQHKGNTLFSTRLSTHFLLCFIALNDHFTSDLMTP